MTRLVFRGGTRVRRHRRGPGAGRRRGRGRADRRRGHGARRRRGRRARRARRSCQGCSTATCTSRSATSTCSRLANTPDSRSASSRPPGTWRRRFAPGITSVRDAGGADLGHPRGAAERPRSRARGCRSRCRCSARPAATATTGCRRATGCRCSPAARAARTRSSTGPTRCAGRSASSSATAPTSSRSRRPAASCRPRDDPRHAHFRPAELDGPRGGGDGRGPVRHGPRAGRRGDQERDPRRDPLDRARHLPRRRGDRPDARSTGTWLVADARGAARRPRGGRRGRRASRPPSSRRRSRSWRSTPPRSAGPSRPACRSRWARTPGSRPHGQNLRELGPDGRRRRDGAAGRPRGHDAQRGPPAGRGRAARHDRARQARRPRRRPGDATDLATLPDRIEGVYQAGARSHGRPPDTLIRGHPSSCRELRGPRRALRRVHGPLVAAPRPQLADLAGIDRSARVLDVGCGTGMLTAELVRRVGPPLVAAVDPSAAFVERDAGAVPGHRRAARGRRRPPLSRRDVRRSPRAAGRPLHGGPGRRASARCAA